MRVALMLADRVFTLVVESIAGIAEYLVGWYVRTDPDPRWGNGVVSNTTVGQGGVQGVKSVSGEERHEGGGWQGDEDLQWILRTLHVQYLLFASKVGESRDGIDVGAKIPITQRQSKVNFVRDARRWLPIVKVLLNLRKLGPLDKNLEMVGSGNALIENPEWPEPTNDGLVVDETVEEVWDVGNLVRLEQRCDAISIFLGDCLVKMGAYLLKEVEVLVWDCRNNFRHELEWKVRQPRTCWRVNIKGWKDGAHGGHTVSFHAEKAEGQRRRHWLVGRVPRHVDGGAEGKRWRS